LDFLQAQAFYICYYGGAMNLEELAERWTLAHTVAVAAWVVVLVLAVAVLLQRDGSTYPTTDARKTYAAENATFVYPANWTTNNCEPGKPFIELPGYIEANYKGDKSYALSMYGTGAFNCIKDRPERFDIYPEEVVASETPCAPGTSTEGERLENGLYLQLQEDEGSVVAIHIRQNQCFAPAETLVLGFAFTDPDEQPNDISDFGPPRVEKEALLRSPQYQDIRELAESIRY
jgi:hypothetical protein